MLHWGPPWFELEKIKLAFPSPHTHTHHRGPPSSLAYLYHVTMFHGATRIKRLEPSACFPDTHWNIRCAQVSTPRSLKTDEKNKDKDHAWTSWALSLFSSSLPFLYHCLICFIRYLLLLFFKLEPITQFYSSTDISFSFRPMKWCICCCCKKEKILLQLNTNTLFMSV